MSEKSNQYLALTIGPVVNTLQSVKSTKAIWAASYMFSYFMKEVIRKINNEKDIVIPYSGKIHPCVDPNQQEREIDPFKDRSGAGLFPDRLIMLQKDFSLHKLNEITREVVVEFAGKMADDLKNRKKTKGECHSYYKQDDLREKLSEYLKKYLKLYTLSVNLPENDNGEKINPVLEINKLLDSLELQNHVIPVEEHNYLVDLFELAFYNFLAENEFGTPVKFPSTVEIATEEYNRREPYKTKYQEFLKVLKPKKGKESAGDEDDKDDDKSQEQFVKNLKSEFKEEFRSYQKYIAVVQADGDNMGDFIRFLYGKKSGEEDMFQRFSKNLLTFAREAVYLITNYGGKPIYAGGDDLLYFAPVANTAGLETSSGTTIFDLVDSIDQSFEHYFARDELLADQVEQYKKETGNQPSMSFGISISYYKFPLNEALEEGLNQLFHTAKKTKTKNAVSYSVLKHSGQHFGTTFHKTSESYLLFKQLLRDHIYGDNFIHSIAYKIKPQSSVIRGIGLVDSEEKRNKMFDNFFLQNFNESNHRINVGELVDFLQHTRDLFKMVYNENPIMDDDAKETDRKNVENQQKIYSALRFIDFVRNKDKDEE